MKLDESCIARRRFLAGMLGGGAAALGAGVAVPVTCYLGNLHEEPPLPFLVLPEAESHVPPGDAKLVFYGRIPALVIRTPEPQGALRAFVATCTHFDCIVGYQPGENRIFCACHGGYYDVEGNVTAGPPPRPLRPFYVAFRQGKLVLALEKENLEEALRAADA